MITKDGERNPNSGKSKAEQASNKGQKKKNTGTGNKGGAPKSIPSASTSTPKTTPSFSTSGSLTTPKPTESQKSSSSSSESSDSSSKKKTLSAEEKSKALSDLMDRATIGSSRTYGLSFQSSANRKISDAESKRKQTLVEQATKKGYLSKEQKGGYGSSGSFARESGGHGSSGSFGRESGGNGTSGSFERKSNGTGSYGSFDGKAKSATPSVLERVGNAMLGGAIQSGGTSLDAVGTMYQAGQGGRDTLYGENLEWYQHQLETEEATLKSMQAENRAKPGTYNLKAIQNQQRIIAEAQKKVDAFSPVKQAQEKSGEAARNLAADVSNIGAKRTEQAKEGASALGQMALDALSSTAQMGVDAAANAVLGTPGSMLPFAFRAFGGGTQEARSEGATLEQQMAFGSAVAAKEIFTEKMFNIAGLQNKAYGKGSVDDYVEKAISGAVDKLAKTETGQRLIGGGLTLLSGAAGEGLEELIGDWMEWQLPRIYKKDPKSAKEVAQDSIYDFLVGALSGTFGSLASPGNILNYQQPGSQTQGQRIVDPTASPLDQAILDTLQGVQTPENVTQTREATALDNAILAAMNQNKNTSADAAEVESTAVNDNPATHTPEQMRAIEEYKNAVSPTVKSFVEKVRTLQNQNYKRKAKVSIGFATDQAVADIAEITGIDVAGSDYTLSGRAIEHIDKRHGANGEANQSMSDINDIARIGYVVENYDGIEPILTKEGKQKYSSDIMTKDQQRAPLVRMYKAIDGTYYVVEAATDAKAHEIPIVSAYIEKRNSTADRVLNLEDASSQQRTSQTPHDSHSAVSIASVSDDTDVPALSGSTGQSPPSKHVQDAPYNASYNSNVAQAADSVNRENVADLGAMQSRFESEPKQSQTQSNTIGTMEEGWNVPEEQRSPIMYDTISEEKSLDNARLRLAQDYEGEKAELRGKYNWSGEEVDMGMTILDNYRRAAEETGDWTQYSEWRKTVSEHGTAAGQALQAYAKYSRQTGGGIVADAQAFLEENKLKKKADTNAIMDKVSSLAERYDAAVGTGNKDADVNVDDLLNVIQDASKARQTGTLIWNKTPSIVEWAMKRIANYARAEAQGEGGENLDFLKTFASDSIYNIASDAQKASAGEKFKTYRRQNMLSKVATVMRNLVSNNVFDPIDSISRNMSVPIDMLLSKITGTRSVAWDASWFSKAKRKGSLDGLAKACMEVGLDVDTSGGTSRYGTTSNRTFKMSDGVMSKLMSTWEAYEGYTLNATDEFQKGGIEAEVQRGIDKLYEKGKIKDNSLQNAGETEALYRTFQDTNALSGAVTGFRSGINKARIGDVGAGDIALTFAQVPANLAARAVEYSPAGGFVAMADFINMGISATKGEFTAAQQAKAVQGLGRALNGSAVIALAAAGALRGWLKVSGDDDDADKNALDKAYGLKGTQLNISAAWRDLNGGSTEWQDGDQLVSIGFLEPINAQFTTGALIANDILEARENGERVTAGQVFGDSLLGAYQAVMDMPLMSDLQDLAQNYQYSDGEKFYQKAGDAAQKYLAGQATSLIPNALRGVAQGLDDTERDAYTSDNVWQQAVDNAKASIPGLRQTLPAKKDVWGNDVKNEGGFRNFMNRNINPGDITTYKQDAVSDELDKISEESGESLYPQRYAPRSIKVGDKDVKLTDEQRDTYQETYGSEYYKAAQSLMQSEGYKDLPATVKAEALRQARKIAEDAAKEAAGVGFEMSDDNRTVADKSAEERVNDLMVRAIQNEKYVSPEAKEKLDRIGRFIDTKPWAEDVPENVSAAAKKEAKAYYSALEAAKYGEPLDEKYEKLADMNQSELAKYFVSQAVGSEKYMTDENKAKMDEVQNLYGSASYVGISPDLIESAKEKTAEYYQEVEKAKYGFELSKDKRKLEGADAKTVADFFLDKAVEAKFEDKNGDGTNKDEILEAYNKNEIDDRTAIAVLSDQQADAYRDYGIAAGVTPRQMLDAASEYARLETYKDMDDQVINSKEAQFDAYLEAQGYPEDQVKAIRMAFYGDKATSYRKAVEKLNAGTITDKEAKKLLTPNYQSGWSHNVAKTGVSMSDYIDALATFEDAPTADERDKMGFDSKWEWFCNELNKNTELTKEQKYAIAISTDRSMSEKTKKKIANKLGTAYVAPTTETGSAGASSAAAVNSGVSAVSSGYSAASQKKELTQAEKAYERFGIAAGATEAMYTQAKAALKNIETVYDMDGNVVRSAEDQFDSWLERQGWTEDQKDAVRAGFYADSVKNLRYLSSELREGNISVAAAKSELSARAQTGWTHSVMDTGAAMADYIDAWVQFKQAPNEDERKAQGFGTKWAWFCDYLNQTDMTAEQKYAIAVSVQDYAESTRKKIQKNVGWDGVSSAEQEPQEETYDIRTDDGYREYLSLLLKRKDRYEAKDGSVWSVGENGDVIVRTKDGRQLRARAVLGRNGFDDEPGEGYTVGSKAGQLAYKMMQNGVMKTWDAPDGWTWKLVRGEIIAEKNGTKIPVRMAG